VNFSVWIVEKTGASVSIGGINSSVSLAIHCPWSLGWYFIIQVANASLQRGCWQPGSPKVYVEEEILSSVREKREHGIAGVIRSCEEEEWDKKYVEICRR